MASCLPMKPIKRRDFIKTSGAAGVGLTLWPLLGKADSPTPPRRPNILVFLTDDHGQWAQHAYGNMELRTPNMDRLAAMGTRMTQAFTTTPVCSPARASFFTGRMPSQHGIHDWLVSPTPAFLKGQTLLSELLQQSGYHTGLIGKWHCGENVEGEPQPGFDRWFSYWINQQPHKGAQKFSDQGTLVHDQGQQSPLLTQQAVDFLHHHPQDAATKDKPFFLFVSHTDTHGPHNAAPAELVQQYHSATFQDIPDEKFFPCHGYPLTGISAQPEEERKKRQEYYAAATFVDQQVGKILDALEASGQMANTVIVYATDHGLNAGHHGMWEKGNGTVPQNFLEESIRVPCTIAWPAGGIAQGATCADLVNHCDLWATLLDIAEAAPSGQIAAEINSPGRSYFPQLKGRRADHWRTTILCEYGNARMARTPRYKLIKRYPYKGVLKPDEFYDLQEDPRETINHYQDASLTPVIAELTAQLDEFFARHTVPEHSGLAIENSPFFHNADTPWERAAKSTG